MDFKPVKQLAAAIPFSPFTVLMKGGRILEVNRPYQMSISPKGKSLIYADDNGDGKFKHLSAGDIVSWRSVAERELA